MKKTLLIIGASGHGKVVADIALKMNRWRRINFLDDDENIKSSIGINVVGKSSDAVKYIHECDLFVGVGNNVIREKIQKKLEDKGANIPILIHPTAVIGKQVNLAAGTTVMAGAVINCGTRVGRGCIINTSATVDHDNLIEDFAHISPGVHLAGTVIVGRGTWIGIGSTVSNNVSIISGSTFGAGSVIVRDITEPGTYVGVPVRRL